MLLNCTSQLRELNWFRGHRHWQLLLLPIIKKLFSTKQFEISHLGLHINEDAPLNFYRRIATRDDLLHEYMYKRWR
jgi:hypothetical protein